MKKNILLFLLGFIFFENAFSQLTNLNWKIGRHTSIDFSSGQVVVNLTDSNKSTMTYANTSICDRNGKIIFYSNACKVYNRNGDTMPNGGGFNHGFYSDQYVNTDYYPPFKGATIIPFSNDSNKFYMFYLNMDVNVDGDYILNKLYYLIVDRTLNGGLGDVTLKDQVAMSGDTLNKSFVCAVKNGNGKDWWIIVRKHKGNKYYKVLVDSSGVHAPTTQVIGNTFNYQYASEGACNVSFAGDRLCNIHTDLLYTPFQLDLLDFDRCTGQLSNYQTIFHPNTTDTIMWWSSCFSSNGRYLYFDDKYKIYQMDLQSNNLLDSVKVVGNNTAMGTLFFNMELAPDGKIYVAPYGSYNYLSVINAPDSAGTACRFVENAVLLGNAVTGPWADGGLPNVPNFSLGAINCNVGIENLTEANQEGINLYPNPCKDELRIRNYELRIESAEVTDLLGRIVLKPTIYNSSFITHNLPSGIYFLKLTDEKGNVITKKFVKEN